MGYLARDLASLRCWVSAKLTQALCGGQFLKLPSPIHSGPLPSPLSDLPLLLVAGGSLGLGTCLRQLSWATQCVNLCLIPAPAPAVTGGLAAALATEASELFPEVALGQQASARWQWLPGSARLALAATLAGAEASRRCDDDLQDVTEKGRVTGGSRSGNPVSVLQSKWEREQGTLQSPGSPSATRSLHQGALQDAGTSQCRTCREDGALQKAKSSQAVPCLGAQESSAVPPEAQRAGCTGRLPAGEDAVREIVGRGSHLQCFMMSTPLSPRPSRTPAPQQPPLPALGALSSIGLQLK